MLLGKAWIYPGRFAFKDNYEPIIKIINNLVDIKLGQFTHEELNVVLTKIINKKAACLDEIPPEVWKTRKFDDIQLEYVNTVYNQNCGVMVIVPGNRHGDTSSNPGRDWLYFT